VGNPAGHAHGGARRSRLRRARGEFIDAQIERELADDRAELARLKAEYAGAVSDAKAKLKAKLDAAEKRVNERRSLTVQTHCCESTPRQPMLYCAFMFARRHHHHHRHITPHRVVL
jgi:hypothetical protein